MRLVCADDDPDIRTILRLALGLDPTLNVTIVASGDAAIRAARDLEADAVLLDAMMPGLDGFETCRQLKRDPATAHIPVLFLTAKTGALDEARVREVGAVASLVKPFDPLTLAADLRLALGGNIGGTQREESGD